MASDKVEQSLKELENKRKNGEIGSTEFYKGLLDILELIRKELQAEQIDEKLAKRQTPLLLTFIKNQIKEFRNRGN
ncbi:hypothetical protein [Aquifex sp.]